jgi:hypothetical protein
MTTEESPRGAKLLNIKLDMPGRRRASPGRHRGVASPALPINHTSRHLCLELLLQGRFATLPDERGTVQSHQLHEQTVGGCLSGYDREPDVGYRGGGTDLLGRQEHDAANQRGAASADDDLGPSIILSCGPF